MPTMLAPWRLGSAKVVVPLPPKVVPRRANSAWFWLIAISWPSHRAKPLGGKPKAKIAISLR